MKSNQKFMLLDIQLFAEPSGENVANADAVNTASGESNDKVVPEAKEKTYTRDELNKIISAEKEKVKAELIKEAENQRTEAEKLAKMNAEEKHKYELDKANQEKNEALAKLNAYELKDTATKIAREKGLDITLLDIIDYSKETADSVKTKIEDISSIFNKAVEDGINKKLQEKSPRNISSSANNEDLDYLSKKYKGNPYYKG